MLIDTLWQSTIHPEDLSKFTDEWATALSAERAFETETRLRRVDGQFHWFLVKKAYAVLQSRNSEPALHALIAFEDIDERKKAKQEHERLRRELAHLGHLDRVSRIGELTASLAHEIKQPIGAAVANAEACLRLLDGGRANVAEAREAVWESIVDARRAADIVDRVRSMYRMGTPKEESVDVNRVIRGMVDMLQEDATRRSIIMRTDLARDLPEAMADRVQLQQVLMNLMLNGFEATCGSGGELVIESRLTEDGQLLISVADSGIGLPSEQAENIFDGFVTTKPDGTGLGLTISRSIVESHGGRIWASANPGRGATFSFTLPEIGSAQT
jgi:signal transduction histidine kinase